MSTSLEASLLFTSDKSLSLFYLDLHICRFSWLGTFVKTSGLVGQGPWLKMPAVSSPAAGYIFSGVVFLDEVFFLETEIPMILELQTLWYI